jgi:hypothetical protein
MDDGLGADNVDLVGDYEYLLFIGFIGALALG